MFVALASLMLAGAPATESVAPVVEAYRAREQVNGVAIVVTKGGRTLLRQGFGTAMAGESISPTAVQPYFSISKQFTAALTLRLVAQRRLGLDDPVGKHLPRWFADEPALRVRHLLGQTSGLAEFVTLPEARAFDASPPTELSLDPVLDLIDRQPRRFPPGERHAYSNSNYTVLARLIEQIEGRPFNAALAAMLADVGLTGIAACAALDRAALSPGFDGPDRPVTLPSNAHLTYAGTGGLCGSADALAAWTRALHAGGVIARGQLRAMRTPDATGTGDAPPYGFGLSTLPVAGRPAFSHAGVDPGWTAWTAYLPQEDLTIAVLANRGRLWLTDLGAPLIRAILRLPEPPPLAQLPLTAAERRRLTGRFDDGLFEISLGAKSRSLMLSNPAFGAPIEFWKQADGRFVAVRRPDSFQLRLTARTIELDWAEHRSYLVPRLAEAERAR